MFPLLAHTGHSHNPTPVEPIPTTTEESQASPSPMMVRQEVTSSMESVSIHPVLNGGTLIVFALVATPIVLITAKNKWYS